MKYNFLVSWTLINGLGLGIGFIIALQIGMFLEHGSNTEMYWQFIPPKRNFWTFLDLFIGPLSLGAVVGLFQSFLLKNRGIITRSWILITAMGFGILGLIDLPIFFMDMIGKFEGPIEPIMITFLGSTLAGIVQFRFLRKKVDTKLKWIFLLILGLFIGIVINGFLFSLFEEMRQISWSLEVFLNGFIVGAMGALFSGSYLFRTLQKQNSKG